MNKTSVSLQERLKAARPDASDWQPLQSIYLPLICRWINRVPVAGGDAECLCCRRLVCLPAMQAGSLHHNPPQTLAVWLGPAWDGAAMRRMDWVPEAFENDCRPDEELPLHTALCSLEETVSIQLAEEQAQAIAASGQVPPIQVDPMTQTRQPMSSSAKQNLTMASDAACLFIDVSTPEGRAIGLKRNSAISCLLLATIDRDWVDRVLGTR
jgi:hypothetical protein